MAQITPAQLKANFPEFSDPTAYSDAFVQYWLTWAYTLLNPDRFLSVLDLGAQLYAAHNLTQERRAYLESQKPTAGTANGPGMAIGPASAKSVDKVSVSYDIASVSEKDAGEYNQTIYGRRLWRLLMIAGMGPIQVGVGCTPPWVFANGMAWPGPPAWPGAPGWGT